MSLVIGADHVALAVTDLDDAIAFIRFLFEDECGASSYCLRRRWFVDEDSGYETAMVGPVTGYSLVYQLSTVPGMKAGEDDPSHFAWKVDKDRIAEVVGVICNWLTSVGRSSSFEVLLGGKYWVETDLFLHALEFVPV